MTGPVAKRRGPRDATRAERSHERSGPTNHVGFMQGRLSPMVDGKIQAFPWGHWQEELRIVEREIEETVKVPVSYMEELYNLRMHLEQVRERLDRAAVRPGPDAGT